MQEELVSVIIPVYNAEKYLCQCLDSVIRQTYKNIEVLCVNDGSSDCSSKILCEYAKKDERIVLIEKRNEGVSKARNDALDISKGNYTLFIDADDWIDKETISYAIEKLKQTESDVVFWPYISEKKTGSSVKHIFNTDKEFLGESAARELHRRFIGLLGEEMSHPELADSLCPVWGKLYRTNLLQGTCFVDLKEIGTYEDGLFNLEVFGRVNKAFYIDKPMYHYRRDGEQSQTAKYRETLDSQWQNLFERMRHYIEENTLGNDYSRALENRIALSIVGLGLNVTASTYSFWEKRKEIHRLLTSAHYRNSIRQLELRFFPIHWRFFFACAKQGFSLAVLLMILAIKKMI